MRNKLQLYFTFIFSLITICTFGNITETTAKEYVSANANSAGDSLYMVGSATSGGWDLALQSAMIQSDADTNIYVYSDTLKAGEFKIKLYPENDFCGGTWLHPISQAQDISETSAAILMGCSEDNPDYKWEITEAGLYTVTANLLDTTLTITLDESFEISYDSLYLMGDATPGGWDFANQVAMTADSEHENVFVWSGKLTIGEMKIKTYADADWCAGEWIHPLSQGQDLSETGFEILVGCAGSNPDYKWVIVEADTGEYKITIDLESTTITFEKTSSTFIEGENTLANTFSLGQNYPNPFNPTTKIEFSVPQSGEVKIVVYDLLGKEVQTLVNRQMAVGAHSVSFTSAGLSTGIYIYRLETANTSITKKMVLVK